MSFDGIIGTFKSYFSADKIQTDHKVFDLVSKVSVGIMFAVAVLAGTAGLVGMFFCNLYSQKKSFEFQLVFVMYTFT